MQFKQKNTASKPEAQKPAIDRLLQDVSYLLDLTFSAKTKLEQSNQIDRAARARKVVDELWNMSECLEYVKAIQLMNVPDNWLESEQREKVEALMVECSQPSPELLDALEALDKLSRFNSETDLSPLVDLETLRYHVRYRIPHLISIHIPLVQAAAENQWSQTIVFASGNSQEVIYRNGQGMIIRSNGEYCEMMDVGNEFPVINKGEELDPVNLNWQHYV